MTERESERESDSEGVREGERQRGSQVRRETESCQGGRTLVSGAPDAASPAQTLASNPSPSNPKPQTQKK